MTIRQWQPVAKSLNLEQFNQINELQSQRAAASIPDVRANNKFPLAVNSHTLSG